MPSFKRTDDSVQLPNRQTAFSCGYDFYLPSNIHIKAKEIAVVDSKIKSCLEANEFLFLRPRSSFCETLCVLGGIIDSDYCDSIKIVLRNMTNNDLFLPRHCRVVQGIICKFGITDDDGGGTSLREGGFGSTGK